MSGVLPRVKTALTVVCAVGMESVAVAAVSATL